MFNVFQFFLKAVYSFRYKTEIERKYLQKVRLTFQTFTFVGVYKTNIYLPNKLIFLCQTLFLKYLRQRTNPY